MIVTWTAAKDSSEVPPILKPFPGADWGTKYGMEGGKKRG